MMIREQSLLRRVELGQCLHRYHSEIGVDYLTNDICRNLQNMLNVRLGSVLSLDDYGLPDFNDIVKEYPDSITRIRGMIKNFVAQYESRITDVRVIHVHDPGSPLLLKFAIEARLNDQRYNHKVDFNTVLTGAGQATVEIYNDV